MRRWRRKSFMISTSKREKKPWREERAKQIVAGQTDWLEAKREREKKRRLSIKGLKSFEKKKKVKLNTRSKFLVSFSPLPSKASDTGYPCLGIRSKTKLRKPEQEGKRKKKGNCPS